MPTSGRPFFYLMRFFSGLGNCLLIAVGFLNPVIARATFAAPQEIPVERLLRNADVLLKKNPTDAANHYLVARIHYLAFSRGAKAVEAYLPEQGDDRPYVVDGAMANHWLEGKRWWHAVKLAHAEMNEAGPRVSGAERPSLDAAARKRVILLREQGWRPPPEISGGERVAHATAALAAFHEALRLAPGNALYALGLASLAEEVVELRLAGKALLLPAGLSQLSFVDSRGRYLRAYRLSHGLDSTLQYRPISGSLADIVSYEAGRGFLRLLARDPSSANATDQAAGREIAAEIARLEKLPQGAITPVVFALRPVSGIAELLAPSARVAFDLRGYGAAERWPWLQPETGLLVWDPARTGVIVSGRQLFGGYTFQIFRTDGYEALAALDDDGDGALRGAELAGIRVWFDRNVDGRSEPAEVRDLAEIGVVGLAVGANGREGAHPSSSHGVEFADGRVLPTWDWIVEPHRN